MHNMLHWPGMLRQVKEAHSFFFSIDFIFLEQCQVHSKMDRKVQRLPVCLLLPHMQASPISNILHQSGTFITADGPTLLHHYHPKSMKFTLGFTLDAVNFVGLDKCIMTSITIIVNRAISLAKNSSA